VKALWMEGVLQTVVDAEHSITEIEVVASRHIPSRTINVTLQF
jgi:hypothetical protein